MLVGGLRTLGEWRTPLVTPAFFWKLLSLEGFDGALVGSALMEAEDLATKVQELVSCGRRMAS